MKGVIVRIHLKRFMAYPDVEFVPGRNLNFVIAPNGCGKSSVLAAIILGLGGKPCDVGRANLLGDYVKTGYNEGSIEIELFNPGKNYVVKRNIFLGSKKSTWLINGEKVTQKQVEDLMSKLCIQVDNLCQVLPQDRVCEFSRMDPQSVLENTEKSVGPESLVKHHNQLKEMTQITTDYKNKLKDKTSRLEKETAINHGLEANVEMMLKKTKFMEKIALHKKQLAWVVYQEKYTLVKDMKTAFKEAHASELHLKKKEEEITAGMEILRKNVVELTGNTRTKKEAMMNLEHQLRAAITHADQKRNDLKKIDDRLMDTKLAEDARLKDLESLRQHLSKLENDLAHYNSVSDVQNEEMIQQITEQILHIQDKFTGTKLGEDGLRDQINKINNEIRAESNKKKRLEDKVNQRLNLLKTKLPHVYNAVMWLRENQLLFKAKIYEPIVLEIDVKDDSYIQYVEQTIPGRDLQAFTCENIDDMNKLISCMRTELNIPVNVIYSGPEHKPSSSFAPRIPAENLGSYGFTRYVKDMFTAPETIMKYLCRTTHLYLIPVGPSDINNTYERITNNFSTFYSDTNKYMVRTSRYTHEKIFEIHSVSTPRLLCRGVDKNEVKEISDKIREFSLKKEGLHAQLSALEGKRKEFEKQLVELRDKKRSIQAIIGKKISTENRIKMKLDAIEKLEAEGIDVEEETRKANLEKNVVVASLCEIDGKIQMLTKKLVEKIREFAEINSKLYVVSAKLKKRKDDERSVIKAHAEQTAKATKLRDECKRAIDEAKHYHQQALKFSNGEVPDDSFFDSITENRETLSRKIQELKAKADFMSEENKNVIVEFQNRKKLIKEISEDIHQLNGKILEMNKNISEIRALWLPALKDLIEKVNHNFGVYFAKMGCAGEVVLHSDDPDDYDQYGMHIKVKFRDEEPLVDLNHITQSGGERSVATAIYVMSLQDLTRVPFRCVDEINQGMDPANERRVYKLLVEVTGNEVDRPQYFFLTPKLLPGLTHSPNVTVLSIMNGSVQKMLGYWNLQKQVKTVIKLKPKKKLAKNFIDESEEDDD